MLPSITPHTSPTITQRPMTPPMSPQPITPPPITRPRNHIRRFSYSQRVPLILGCELMRLFTRNKVLKDSENINVECSVCLETHKKSNCVYIINCNHMFCRRCFFSWMNTHDTCPLCRVICRLAVCYC